MRNTSPSEDTIDLQRYLAVLVRRKWVAILSLVGVVSSTVIVSWLTTPVYEATVILKIEERELSIGSELLRPVDPFGRTRTSFVDAEVQILRSRTIAEAVVRRLNLDWKVHKLPEGVSLSLSPTVIDSSARTGTYSMVFEDDQGRYGLFDVDGQMIGRGEIDSPFREQAVAFTLSDVRAQRGDEIKFSILDFQGAVDQLRGRTSVVPVKATNIIRVTVQGDAPEQVAATANAIVEAYSDQSLRRKTGQAFSAHQFLDAQLLTVAEELARSEQALEDYKSEAGVITLGDEVQASLQRLTEIELQQATVEAQRVEAESLLNQLEDPTLSSGRGFLISTSGMSNLLITGLAATLTDLEIERSSREAVFTARHPSVIAIRTQIAEAKRNLIAEVRGAISALREREQALAGIIQRYEGDLRNLPEVELNLVSLLRTSRINEGIYTFLLQKLEETRIAEASEVGNVFIIDPAISPRTPVKPTTRLNAILGVIVGLALGVGLAFLLERLDNTIKTTEDVEHQLGLPVFGSIPEVYERERQRVIPGPSASGQETAPQMLTIGKPRWRAVEAYRTLRTSIQYANPDQLTRTILVTSAAPGEGKTATVANLAIVLAQAGRRVLLVGSDMRKPEIHLLFGTPGKPGFSEILTGKVDWRSAVQSTDVESLKLIPSGAIPPNPAEILGSKHLTVFLDEIRADFDMILFDSPPVLGFADAAVLGNKLDSTFLVIEAGRTTAQMATRVKAILENVHIRVAGAILNKVKSDGLDYGYYYQDYYKGYESYGEVEKIRGDGRRG